MPSSGAGDAHRERTAPVVLRLLDHVLDTFALLALVAMVVVVCWQVFGRYVLNSSPRGSSEMALVLLGWVTFLGIAIGVRDRSHIAVGLVVDRLPEPVRAVVSRLGALLMAVFGVYLTVQGWEFTKVVAGNTMPGTGLPRWVQYAAMPVSGVLIAVYALLDLLGISSTRAAQAAEGLADRQEGAGLGQPPSDEVGGSAS